MRLKDGDNFKEILAEKGLRPADLARSIGKTQAFVSYLISGDRGCTAETAQLILNALEPTDLTVKSLFVTRVHEIDVTSARGRRSSLALPEAS